MHKHEYKDFNGVNRQSKNKAIIIDPGTIFHTKYSGDVEVIEDLGIIETGWPSRPRAHHLKIRFIATGNEKIVTWSSLRDGTIKDVDNFKSKVGEKAISNSCGPMVIVEDYGTCDIYGNRSILVEFEYTGAKVKCLYNSFKTGQVMDPTYGSTMKARIELGPMPVINVRRMLKTTHTSMMNRCYNTSSSLYKTYGGRGVTVAPEWHDFETFFNDAQQLPGWQYKLADSYGYHLDKDILQFDKPSYQRVYSKDTCMWVPYDINETFASIQSVDGFNCIYSQGGMYYVRIFVPHDKRRVYRTIGPFNDLNAAAIVANNIMNLYGMNNISRNIISEMPIEEIISHNLGADKLCRDIEK